MHIDGADDGISSFNLTEAITLYANGNPDIGGLFFDNLSDAQNNINQLDPLAYENTVNGQVIYARAFENAECFTIVEIILEVQPLSDLGLYDSLTVCADEEVGLALIVDVTLAWDFLKNDFPSSDEIYLFSSEEDALLELNELPLEEKVFGPFDERAFYFRIEEDNACEFIGKLDIDLVVVPDFENTVTTALCNGEVELMAPEGYDNYIWSTNVVGQQNIVVEELGQYTVTFSNSVCEFEQTFFVENSSENKIKKIDVLDFRRNNEVRINMEVEQDDVLYSIDAGNTFQSSNFFKNVQPGIYDVFVDLGCSILKETIIVGGLATFFTPNSDGFNDIWTLSNAEFFPNFNISIFDRYGKYVGGFNNAQIGWDGNLNSSPVPSDDYWYKLELEEGRTITGYFALKR